ncbi:CD59 glycoprotein-like [Dendropsophus ebraccatus]|uniref:CD59 glycoprotein-like n=1 Tax=Dendropsophus ebraccatus TaxID=150705 RepID=UPI0038322E96
MSSAGNCCVVLAVALIFLSLCSTGQAIQCYNCKEWSSSKCGSSQACSSSEDACMRITRSDGNSFYSCRVYSQCSLDIIRQEFGLQNFELKCCQQNLCNSSVMAHSSTVLLLSLAALLLMMMS